MRVGAAGARQLRLTKAGQELFASPPALTQHLRELAAQYGQRRRERNGSQVALPEASRRRRLRAEAVAASAQQLPELLA